MDPPTAEKIKEWLRLDDRHRALRDSTKEVTGRKAELEKDIKTYVKANRLHDAQIKVNDGTLRFVEKKVNAGLTLKFLKEQLQAFFGSRAANGPVTADTLYAFVVGNRKETVSFDMIREIQGGSPAGASAEDD
jgi:hypothetical protein